MLFVFFLYLWMFFLLLFFVVCFPLYWDQIIGSFGQVLDPCLEEIDFMFEFMDTTIKWVLVTACLLVIFQVWLNLGTPSWSSTSEVMPRILCLLYSQETRPAVSSSDRMHMQGLLTEKILCRECWNDKAFFVLLCFFCVNPNDYFYFHLWQYKKHI